jgi:hypothetical protein
MMISSAAIIAATDSVDLHAARNRSIDQIGGSPQGEQESAKPRGVPLENRPFSVPTRAPRGPPADGLEDILGRQTQFSISEFAALINRSPATVWRLLRLGQLSAVRVGGSLAITRGEALRFLRYGAPTAA